jgi:hypothetical protein
MTFDIFGLTLIRTRDLKALRAAAARVSSQQGGGADPESGRPAGDDERGPEQGTTPPRPEVPRVPEPDEEAGLPEVVAEVIRLADGVLDLRDGLGSSVADGQPAATVLRWAGARARSLMAACEVTQLEESGAFDPVRHKAVASREAPSVGLVRHIADTVRPGYAWRGELLRPQEVVVYAPAMNEQENKA